jgi:hypothetical protein
LQWEDRNLMVLNLKAADTGMVGTLATPKRFEMSSEGVFSKLAGPVVEYPVGVTVGADALQLLFKKPDDETGFEMKLKDPEHAVLRFSDAPGWMAPLLFTRAASGEQPKVAEDWVTVRYPADIVALQEKLQTMFDEDQAIRFTPEISNRAMDEMSAKHRPELVRIREKYGWPKRSQFGREAAHHFFVIVQHQGPDLQREWIGDMEKRVQAGEASEADYTLLYDRVQTGLGQPQRWGNNTRCVNGKAVASLVEDPSGLAARREAAHLPPMEEYLKMLDDSCAKVVP